MNSDLKKTETKLNPNAFGIAMPGNECKLIWIIPKSMYTFLYWNKPEFE